MDKKSLRLQCLAMRERIAPDEAKAASMEAARLLVSYLPVSVAIIAGYRAMRSEIDIAEAMTQLFERGHELCLPVIGELREPLKFRRWHIGQEMETGRYGIEVPPASEPELVPDVVLVPLVAFDDRGHRLGYGAGFYDATIHHLRRKQKQVRIVGVAYAAQQVRKIPDEPHDAVLDAVVTEKGIEVMKDN